MLPGFPAFVKLSGDPMSGLAAAFLVQNLGDTELQLPVRDIKYLCALCGGFFFPSRSCEDRCDLLGCSNVLELGWKNSIILLPWVGIVLSNWLPSDLKVLCTMESLWGRGERSRQPLSCVQLWIRGELKQLWSTLSQAQEGRGKKTGISIWAITMHLQPQHNIDVDI